MNNILVDTFMPFEENPIPPTNFRQGLVTGAGSGGVFVHLDGDDEPLPAVTAALDSLPGVGSRVMVMIHNRRAIIMGSISTAPYLRIGPVDNLEASVRLQRQWDATTKVEAYYYVQNNSSGVASMLTRINDQNHANLWIRGDGQVGVETYAASPTTEAIRPLPFASAEGSVAVPAIDNGQATEVAVTFPSGRFTVIPSVVATPWFSNGSARLTIGIEQKSTSGFTIQLNNWSGTNAGNQSVGWIAMQLGAA